MILAVYGTMKKGFRNHGRLQGARLVARGDVSGYRMHSIGHAPALVADKRFLNKATGVELYEVPKALIESVVDVREGVASGVYYRTVVRANVHGRTVRAVMYAMSEESLAQRDHGKIDSRIWEGGRVAVQSWWEDESEWEAENAV